jgi:hypothetical protein
MLFNPILTTLFYTSVTDILGGKPLRESARLVNPDGSFVLSNDDKVFHVPTKRSGKNKEVVAPSRPSVFQGNKEILNDPMRIQNVLYPLLHLRMLDPTLTTAERGGLSHVLTKAGQRPVFIDFEPPATPSPV